MEHVKIETKMLRHKKASHVQQYYINKETSNLISIVRNLSKKY